MSLVWKLLRRNISAGQLAGYAIANLVGLTIVLTAMQFYRDISSALDDEDTFVTKDYLIITKKVSTTGALFGKSTSFSKGEIENIKAQTWTRKVGGFNAAGFNVAASLEMAGRSISTWLFFESVPDDFFDVKPKGWGFDPANPRIPIVISKDYLSLYNFGFAASRGMPQISESMVGMVPLTISLSGNGRQQYFKAKVVGFSSRLNTIAVPESFMQWANSQFADRPIPDPSRLIIEVSSPGDPAVEQYLADRGYEAAGDRLNNGRMAYFLSVMTSIVVAVGVIISLLAFFILILSLYLLLQKNRDKLRDLMLLGYTPRQVAANYRNIVVVVNVAVLVLAAGLMFLGRSYWSGAFEEMDMDLASVWPTVLIGAVIMATITVCSIYAISRKITRLF